MARSLEERISWRTCDLGADLVGFAPAVMLRKSPSYQQYAQGTAAVDDGAVRGAPDIRKSPFEFSEGWSAIVVALAHPAAKPELDWFTSRGNTPGNASLIRMTRELAAWLEEGEGLSTSPLHYYVEKGGIYLKDAAVLAGIGCIGRNNLLITPQFGPRVRLRALMVNVTMECTGPIDFDPCTGCAQYCRHVCPQTAFAGGPAWPVNNGDISLPGRDGSYRRARCLVQMDREWASLGSAGQDPEALGMDDENELNLEQRVVKHCRQCELSCPVGNDADWLV